jgi:hypothetical protein
MFNVQDYSILYNDAVYMHIGQGWYLGYSITSEQVFNKSNNWKVGK